MPELMPADSFAGDQVSDEQRAAVHAASRIGRAAHRDLSVIWLYLYVPVEDPADRQADHAEEADQRHDQPSRAGQQHIQPSMLDQESRPGSAEPEHRSAYSAVLVLRFYILHD